MPSPVCVCVPAGLAEMLMFLVGTRRLVVADPAQALVGCAMVTFSGMMLNSAAGYTNPVHHFPQQRAAVTSLVKSFVGLSGAVVTQAFVYFCAPAALPCVRSRRASVLRCMYPHPR